jgi:5-methyltetrahydrofolate corrinoid/iron sulfur protein methyltransferase
MLQDIAPGVKSTCGLSNISNGPPDELRPILNQTYMVMLERRGMYSCIADAYDDGLIAIARGERQDIVALIHKVMEGEAVDEKSLPEDLNHGWKLADYVKTARVILGQSLFSDSWLEV